MCGWFIALSFSDLGMIIFPLMAILSVIAISSLNYVVDGQPLRTSSAKVLKCLSSKVTFLISSAFMEPDMSVHDSIALLSACLVFLCLYLFNGCA